MRVGVLAVQGDFREHAEMLQRLGADVVEVRKPRQTSRFEADLDFRSGAPLRGLFIRAPRVRDARPAVEVLAEAPGQGGASVGA